MSQSEVDVLKNRIRELEAKLADALSVKVAQQARPKIEQLSSEVVHSNPYR